MYKVLVVDDESASLKHICNIITGKCPDFAVVGTARNGQMAMEKIEESKPDVLFSDVMMPGMNGIELVTEVKRLYPEVLSVIVSGYNDFQYAKGAISAGVCDYILKPVRPSDVAVLMEELHRVLDKQYYERRMLFLKKISMGMEWTDRKEMECLFPDENYYAAICRRNGLPARFTRSFSADMYSMPQEKVLIYGRDEKEALYLCPGRLLQGESFESYFHKVYDKMRKEDDFFTAVLKKNSFRPEELAETLKKLYRKLDERIVIGKNNLLFLDEDENRSEEEYPHSFEMLKHYVRKKDSKGIRSEVMRLFREWEKQECPQIRLEERIHYLLIGLVEKGYIERFSEFVLDDIFAEAASMEDLAKSILVLLDPGAEQEQIQDKREEEYDEILHYLEEHLEENISAQSVCRKFAVCQTVLSKIFRKYGGCSFSSCLTGLRMEQAKKIMQENSGILVRDVAEKVGYSDQFYFSRVFRAAEGLSPSEYLEKHAKERENIVGDIRI